MIKIPGYTIHDQLGEGGMATVYRATQESLQREVALKVVNKLANHDASFRRRFLNEGHDLASLRHNNIATIYDISETGTYSYYAMELLESGSLADKMERGLSINTSIDIIIQIGYALDYAHNNHIVHRDLKPNNILFRDANTPILTDFGIAKNINRDSKLTEYGVLVGTPSYMSPEQCRGRDVDGRSDQYALCILLFELITGYLPFDADDPIAIATKQVTEPTPKLPESLRPLQPIIDIALDKEPEGRYSSMAEFCRVLEEVRQNDLYLTPYLSNIVKRQSQKDTDDSISFDLPKPDYDTQVDPSDTISIPQDEEFWQDKSSNHLFLFIALFMVLLVVGVGYYFLELNPIAKQQVTHSNSQLQRILERQLENQFQAKQFLTPENNNALSSIQKLSEVAPQSIILTQYAQRIAEFYVNSANQFIQEDNFESAKIQIENALKFDPSNKNLNARYQEISQHLAKTTYKARLEKMESEAKQLLKNGHFWEPKEQNAAQKLAEIISLNPFNEFAKNELQKLEQQASNLLAQLIDNNQLIEAENKHALIANTFPSSELIATQKKRLSDLINARQLEKELAMWIEKGKRQLLRGKVSEPVDDNAIYYFRKAYSLSNENKVVNQHLDEIANSLFQEARMLMIQNRPVSALSKVRVGLKARPEHRALNALKHQLESELD